MTNREEQLNHALEAMHFGFRAMTLRPDQRLAELGLSRIHHRLLYFIGRNSKCSINELLEIMGITKQYLHRPLKTLIACGYILQTVDSRDRRIKRLRLSPEGEKLEFALSEVQRRRFEEIFEQVGPGVERHWRQVMDLLGNSIEF
jgi:DNA-binding MarR family transcriptional regulator